MQAQAYRITENRRLESVPPERVSGDWKASGSSYWMDLHGSSKDALEHYLEGHEYRGIELAGG